MPILAKFDTADTMLARLQQATTFALIGLALAWVIVHASRGAVVVGIAGALFIVFAYAIVLAIEMLGNERDRQPDFSNRRLAFKRGGGRFNGI